MMTHGTTATSTRTPLTALVAIIALALPSLTLAQSTPMTADDHRTYEVRYTATFSEGGLAFGRWLGYDTVRLEGVGCLNEAGRPMLPAQTLRIALPAGMTATNVRVGEPEFVELTGQYVVYPAQPPWPMPETCWR